VRRLCRPLEKLNKKYIALFKEMDYDRKDIDKEQKNGGRV